jgi:hypothetical protein
MQLIEPDEWRHFLNILASRSCPADDFELRERDLTDPKSDELCPLKGYVTIRRVSNNANADYPTGDATSWVEAFERDLRAGHFG